MRLRIFQVASSYHIHDADCAGCETEPREAGPPGGEAFASQDAIFLHLWGPEILARQVQADGLHSADSGLRPNVSDVTDLWIHTVFMPCTHGLPRATVQELKILVT